MNASTPESNTRTVGTNTFHQQFVESTVFVFDMHIVEYKNEKFIVIYDQCFRYEYPLVFAIRQIQHNQECLEHNAYRTDIQFPLRDSILTEGKTLFTAPLFRRNNSEHPTMYVHDNTIFDVRVPLDVVFFPLPIKINYLDGQGHIIGNDFDLIGPAEVLRGKSKPMRCWNCYSYGSFRGVFVALCPNCAGLYQKESPTKQYLGLRECEMVGCGIHDITPEQRHKVLPVHLIGTRLVDIGYTDVDVDGCSTIEYDESSCIRDEATYNRLKGTRDVIYRPYLTLEEIRSFKN
jgi:hypothetical protein